MCGIGRSLPGQPAPPPASGRSGPELRRPGARGARLELASHPDHRAAGEIAARYDSYSRFTAAFRACFDLHCPVCARLADCSGIVTGPGGLRRRGARMAACGIQRFARRERSPCHDLTPFDLWPHGRRDAAAPQFPSSYPPSLRSAWPAGSAPWRCLRLRILAVPTRLPPGAASALGVVYLTQDEFIHVLEGCPALVTDAGARPAWRRMPPLSGGAGMPTISSTIPTVRCHLR